MQIPGRIQRDRLKVDTDATVYLRGGKAGTQHRRRVVRPRGRGDDQARDVAQRAEGVVVVEVPTEAPLVGVGGDADNHRVAVLALREERERGGLTPQLVESVVQVGEVLDLRYRQQTGQAPTEREAKDRLLVEQCVENTPSAEFRMQTPGDAVHAALAGHVLAEDKHAWPGGEAV